MWREGGGESRQAVILAGGSGTRLRSRLGAKPKPLVEVGGTPLLGHQLELLRKHNFKRVILLVNYAAEQIQDYCRIFEDTDIRITIIDDGKARGTAGAVLNAIPHLADQFVVLYGDTMLDVDLTRFWNWHSRLENVAASLLLHPNDHPDDSDLVEIDAEHRILAFHPYPHADDCYVPNLVNAALYVICREALRQYGDHQGTLDFARDLFPRMLRSGALLRGYLSSEYIKDVGTPERLDKVNRDFSASAIRRTSLSSPKPAVFVDRDGTLNEDRGHIASPEELAVFDFVGPALRRLNEAEWRTIMVTNQPVLARGEASYEELRRIHGKLDYEIARHGAYFDRVYICPHHPHSGFPGEVSELKVKCGCRKPAPGMIYQAQTDFNLDLTQCWFIGDTDADIGAAYAANVTSILVLTGPDCKHENHVFQPDFIATNFVAAVDFILDVYPRLSRACDPILELIDSPSDWFIAGSSDSARKFIARTLKRELNRRGKPVKVQGLEGQPPGNIHAPRGQITSEPETVLLWEGEAFELSRELDMLHHCVWVEDADVIRNDLSGPHHAAYTFDLREILKIPEGIAA